MLNNPYRRSPTKRHWDQICIELITIGTAAFAALLLISGLVEGRPDTSLTINLLKLTITGASAITYALLIMLAAVAIFQDRRTPLRIRERRKTEESTRVFSTLGVLITLAAAMILCVIFIPPDAKWSGDMSRTIRIKNENWARLEALVGPEGTADQKIRRLLDIAGEFQEHQTEAGASLEEHPDDTPTYHGQSGASPQHPDIPEPEPDHHFDPTSPVQPGNHRR